MIMTTEISSSDESDLLDDNFIHILKYGVISTLLVSTLTIIISIVYSFTIRDCDDFCTTEGKIALFLIGVPFLVLFYTASFFPAILFTGLVGAKLITAIQLHTNQWIGKLPGLVMVAIMLSATLTVEIVLISGISIITDENNKFLSIALIATGVCFYMFTLWHKREHIFDEAAIESQFD
jgi:hypothetical protein